MNWLLGRHLQQTGLSCIVCGCTEDNACIIPGTGPCRWVTPGLCSNPECVEVFELETAQVGAEAED